MKFRFVSHRYDKAVFNVEVKNCIAVIWSEESIFYNQLLVEMAFFCSPEKKVEELKPGCHFYNILLHFQQSHRKGHNIVYEVKQFEYSKDLKSFIMFRDLQRTFIHII